MLQKPYKNPKLGLLEQLFFAVVKAGVRGKLSVWRCDLVTSCRFCFPASGAAQLHPPGSGTTPLDFPFLPVPIKFPAAKSFPQWCLHNSAFVPGLVKQKGVFFPLPGWGQRMPGEIKRAWGLWCTFGRGDNGAAQGGSSSTQKICSQYFQTWILGITLSSRIKGGSSPGFWAHFWKKGALFEGREMLHTGSAQELLAAFENIPVV